MFRPMFIPAALVLAAVTVFLAGQHLGSRWWATRSVRTPDDLDWLRLEFRLSDAELARVRQLHDGYLPKCRDFCDRVDARKTELLAALTAGTNAPAGIEQKLVEIGMLRAQCQAAMLRHFREVSQAMPSEQGQRYLAEMQRLTLGFHEQVERNMSSGAPSPHGHR